jgi:Flp pilus assembly protein TadG
MVTAELAAALPVLMLLVTVGLSAVSVSSARVRAADAACEAARAAARGDPARGRQLAGATAPGVEVALSSVDGTVVAIATLRVRPFGGRLPAITLSERAVAAAEPGSP